MEKQEIVRQLTQKGVLVTPEILERINSGEVSSPEDLSPQAKKSSAKLSVVIKKHETMKSMSPQDFVSYYKNRYIGLKSILLKKMQAVSINKVTTASGETSVMGMVKERNPQGFVMEDETGEISIVSKDDVREDDVVGVSGEIREGKIIQKELVWPDIPLENQAGTIPGALLFTTFLDDNIKRACGDMSLIFMPGVATNPIKDDGKNLMSGLPNPCTATVKKDGKEFSLLIYRPGREVSSKDAIEFLRRRHLSPEKQMISTKTDPYLIEPVPDVFWLVSNTRHVERYKGVTIIITKEEDAVKYDAGTGEVYFAYDQPAPKA